MHGYVCRRLRDLPDSLAERLANDPAARDAFWEEERRRCSDPEDGFLYYMDNYASHVSASGQQEVLELWPFQRDYCQLLVDSQAIISLKARRVGVTVCTLHFLAWTAVFKPGADQATIAVFSLNHKAAKSALKLIRKGLEALPAGLYPRSEWGAEAGCTDTTEEIGFSRGATISSFATGGGSRGQTLTVAYWDEAARAESSYEVSQEMAEALLPSIEGGGKLIITSTGRGRTGRGAVFARLWDRASAGELGWQTFFVSRLDRPGRTAEWFERKKLELGTARAEQEYPADPEQALMGSRENAWCPAHHIAAAEAAGREIDARGTVQPYGRRVWIGLDWGMNSSALLVVPRENGSVYVAEELVCFGTDAETVTRQMVAMAQPYLTNGTQLSHVYYDSAGAQASLSMLPVLKLLSPHTRAEAVRFNKTRKNTGQFLKGSLERTASDAGFACIAISPRCKQLLQELRDGQMAPDGDRVKGTASAPDHAFDALLAALAETALLYQRASSRVA